LLNSLASARLDACLTSHGIDDLAAPGIPLPAESLNGIARIFSAPNDPRELLSGLTSLADVAGKSLRRLAASNHK
jgi:hypothetical protein